MEPRARYILVGTLVLVFSFMMVGAVLWLSEFGSMKGAKRFIVYFKESALSGLQKDSIVTMRGIKVGSVANLQISPKNIELVKVNLLLDHTAPIKTDTKAIINRNLLTGFATIDLVKGTQDSPPLVAVPVDEEYPVIPEGRTDLEVFADSLPEFVEKSAELLSRVRLLLSDRNVELFSAIVTNTENFTGLLAANRSRFESIIQNFDRLSVDIEKLSSSLVKFADRSDQQLSEVSSEIVASLKDFRTTLTELKTEVGGAAVALGKSSQTLSQDVASMVQSIAAAADAATSALEGFEQPRKLITGPHQGAYGPGEKRE